MTVLSTVRSTLFIAACFLAFALTACDTPPARKQQAQSSVVSKKITMKEASKAEKAAPKDRSKKTPAPSKSKIKNQKEKVSTNPEQPEKTESSETIQVSRSLPAYSSAGKINPFIQLIQVENSEKEKKKKPERQLTPLEKLDLSQLQLVAIVQSTGDGDDFAMVQEAGGKGYILQKGTYIGTNSGIVTRIENDKIIIKESFTDFRGDEQSRKKKMKLHKQDNKE